MAGTEAAARGGGGVGLAVGDGGDTGLGLPQPEAEAGDQLIGIERAFRYAEPPGASARTLPARLR